ncbi:hypothetical protein C8R21_1418 [Nitrosospira multiformis]|uniref:Large polyvalent protein associated domain-containing protein n=1 Tax=Nitrosospira multiformis TaxID=1231 RepID=A0A2T5I4B8_9PROT|nr:hypothetical protein C8R21_1418 [Nitrosospira multiformis]
MEPLDWRGDDLAKMRALIHTFVKAFENKALEFKDDRYDFNRREFIGRLGKPLDRGRFSSAQVKEWEDQRERLRQQCVAEFSSSPLYQARALIDPEYWNVLSRGRALVSHGSLSQSFSRQTKEPRHTVALSFSDSEIADPYDDCCGTTTRVRYYHTRKASSLSIVLAYT